MIIQFVIVVCMIGFNSLLILATIAGAKDEILRAIARAKAGEE